MIVNADARHLPFRDQSVQCCVTSPPYWGLRLYNAGPMEIGLEATPDAYVQTLVEVFREVRRVLKDDGTLWLNLGDSYASSPPGNATRGVSAKSGLHGVNGASGRYRDTLSKGVQTKRNTVVGSLKPKDLVGIPWRVAFALQADGWWLRSAITWCKPAPMPESVLDRPTKATEMVFLLTKSSRYFYDAAAVREGIGESRNLRDWWAINSAQAPRVSGDGNGRKRSTDCPVHGDAPMPESTAVCDARRVAFLTARTVDTDGRRGTTRASGNAPTHRPLFEDSVLENSDCSLRECEGTANGRNIESRKTGRAPLTSPHETAGERSGPYTGGNGRLLEGAAMSDRTPENSIEPGCVPDETENYPSEQTDDDTLRKCSCGIIDHFAVFPEALPERCIKAGTKIGDTVLDPFLGSGTTGRVAEWLGRRWAGCDLAYHDLSKGRTQQRGLKWLDARRQG